MLKKNRIKVSSGFKTPEPVDTHMEAPGDGRFFRVSGKSKKNVPEKSFDSARTLPYNKQKSLLHTIKVLCVM